MQGVFFVSWLWAHLMRFYFMCLMMMSDKKMEPVKAVLPNGLQSAKMLSVIEKKHPPLRCMMDWMWRNRVKLSSVFGFDKLKYCVMVSFNKVEMQQWKCQRKNQQAELAYSCRQRVGINTKSIEVARNCPRHKRQLQSQFWRLLLAAIIRFGWKWRHTLQEE